MMESRSLKAARTIQIDPIKFFSLGIEPLV